jgi:mannose-1-phosphate guanylyltransferase
MSVGTKIRPVILSGGAGTRLWPLSRLDRPKPFIALMGGETLLQATARRAEKWGPPTIVTGADQAAAVAEQLPGSRTLIEPSARSTAPAIALAALGGAEDALLLVLPSDHHVADEAAFEAAVERGAPLAELGWLVTFGVTPERAETGYGYIKAGAALADGVFRAQRFAEKPDRAMAEAFLAEGGWAWNSGIFLFRADAYLAALAQFAPEISQAVEHDRFADAPALSIDKAVMERADRVAVVPVDMGWSDIGSWDALHAVGAKDGEDNVVTGEALAVGSRGCLIRSDGPTVVALGVEDLIIVATDRAVLVLPRGQSQRVKEALDALEAQRDKGDRG